MAQHDSIEFLTVARLLPAAVGAPLRAATPAAGRGRADWVELTRDELVNAKPLSLVAATTRDVLLPRAHIHRLHHPLAAAAWSPPSPDRPGTAELRPRELLRLAERDQLLLAVTLVELSPLTYLRFGTRGAPGRGPARRLLAHLRSLLPLHTHASEPPAAMSCLMGLERIPVLILSAVRRPPDLDPLVQALRRMTVQSLTTEADGGDTVGPGPLLARIRQLAPAGVHWEENEAAVGDVYTMLLPPEPPVAPGPRWVGGFVELTVDGTFGVSERRMVLGPFDAVHGAVPPQDDLPDPPPQLDLAALASMARRSRDTLSGLQVKVVLAWHEEMPPLETLDEVPSVATRRALRGELERVALPVQRLVFDILVHQRLRSGCLADARSTASEFAERLALLLHQDLAAFVEVFEGVLALKAEEGYRPAEPPDASSFHRDDQDHGPGKHWIKLLRRVLRLLRLRGTTLQRPPDLRGFDNRVAFEITRHAVRCLSRSFLRHHGLPTKVLLLEHDDEQPQVDHAGLPYGVGIHIHPAWVAQPFWWTLTLLHELAHAVHHHRGAPRHASMRSWRRRVVAFTAPFAVALDCPELCDRGRAPGSLLDLLAWALWTEKQHLAQLVVRQGSEVWTDLTALATIHQALDLQSPEDAETNGALAWKIFWWSWLPAIVRAAGTDYGWTSGTESPRISRDAEEGLAVRVLLLSHVQAAHLGGTLAPELNEPDGVVLALGQVVDRLRRGRASWTPEPSSSPQLSEIPTADARQPAAAALDWLSANTAPEGDRDRPPPFVWKKEGAFASGTEALDRSSRATVQTLVRGIVELGLEVVRAPPPLSPATSDSAEEHVDPVHVLRAVGAFLADHRAALGGDTAAAPTALPILFGERGSGLGISALSGSIDAPERTPAMTARLEQASAVEHRFLLGLASMDRWSRLHVLADMFDEVDEFRAAEATAPEQGPQPGGAAHSPTQ